MNYNWNLDNIYTGFDSPKYQNDIAIINQLTEKLNADCELWQNTDKPLEALEAALRDFSEIYLKLGATIGFASLRFTVNTSDNDAITYQEKGEERVSKLTRADVKFTRFVGGLDNLEALIAQSDYLKTHAFYLRRLKARCAHMLSDDEEVVIAKMMMTGSSSWSMLQEKLTSMLEVQVDHPSVSGPVTLSEARAMAYSPDQSLRKAAYEAELIASASIEESIAAALNSIKGEVITLTERRGFSAPLDDALFRTKMQRETLDALIGAIEAYLPKIRAYYKKKGQLLGDDKGIKFYNLFAPVGSSSKAYSYEEGMAFVIENFYTFSQRLGDYATRARDERWIDVEPKPGKVGGAYCAPIPSEKEARILLNYKGSLGDVITAAHELGHGFHDDMLKDCSPLNIDVPMPLAETASTFCETIVGRAALKSVAPEERVTVLENSLQDAGQCIVDIYSRYLFESRVFEQRKAGSISAAELKDMMLQAQADAYGDGMDPEYRHGYMWLNKGHYYSATYNFYNFPYAFGLLFAKGLYKIYQEEGEAFIPKYEQLLTFTGQETIENVCASVGIDVTDISFWKNSLDVICEEIEAFIELV